MRLTLPEALLLFALHDAKGTVHKVAFLAIDHGLRAALLAELKLRGHVQARLPGALQTTPSEGEIRHHPRPSDPPTMPILRDALSALATAPSPAPPRAWLQRISEVMPDLRERLTAVLEQRGILGKVDRERAGLTDEVAHPLADGAVEAWQRAATLAALGRGDEIHPRDGVLVALTVACHLQHVVFGERAEEAEARAAWVAEREVIVAAAQRAIAEAEGEW